MKLLSRLTAVLLLVSVSGCCCVVGGGMTAPVPTPAGSASAENRRPNAAGPEARAQVPADGAAPEKR
jgi:hypothetical protein